MSSVAAPPCRSIASSRHRTGVFSVFGGLSGPSLAHMMLRHIHSPAFTLVFVFMSHHLLRRALISTARAARGDPPSPARQRRGHHPNMLATRPLVTAVEGFAAAHRL